MSYALEKMKNKGEFEAPLFSKLFLPGFGGIMGSCGAMGANWKKRRPIASGIPRFVVWITSGIIIGYYAEQYREAKNAKRDAMIMHYIELHPEDFPPPERKKFSELFLPWTPCR